MDTKEYLRQIRKIDYGIKQRTRQANDLRLMHGLSATDYSRDRVQTSPDGQGFTRIVLQIVELEEEADELSRKKQRIVKQIEAIEKQDLSEVLLLRYVEKLGFEAIADRMCLSYSRVTHLHGEALSCFRRKYLQNDKKLQEINQKSL